MKTLKRTILMRTAMMLTALMCCFTAKAQETLTVYDETDTNNYTPFYGYYADYGTRCQFIIPASDLADLDGGIISALTFYTSSASASFNQGVTIYLKEVDYTTFGTAALENWSSMTAVYTGTIGVSNNQMTISFTTPYTYEGGNLMIGFQVTTWGTSCPSISWYGVNQSSGTYTAAYNNANNSHTWSSTVQRLNFIPKTTFTYEKDNPTCPKPTNLTVSDITAHTATVTWESDFTSFNLQYKASTTDMWTEVNGLTEKNYILTALNSGASYQVQVRAIGTNETSKWKKASFNTLESMLTPPTGLSCTAITGTTATLSWTESGTSTVWQICLDGDEANPITVTENPCTLTDLTSEHVYSARARAVNDARDDWSAWSAPVSFMPTNRVTIGSGSSTQSYGLPTNTGMKYTFSQQLYTPGQLGITPCTFTGMDFMGTNFYSSDRPSVLRKLDIYMVQTDQTIFTGNWTDWVPITYDNLVFSGDVTFLENEWTVINFDTPFIYDGTKNVCVVVYDHTGTAGYNGNFVTFKTNGNISKYLSMYANGANAYDVTNLSFQGSSCSQSNNYIRLLKEAYPTCERPTVVNVGTITPYTATLTWQGSGSKWNLQYKQADADEWTTVEGLTTQSYTLTNLTPETAYYVGVQTDCDGGDLSLWKRTTFATTEVTPTPTALECTGYTATTAMLSWTENGEATAWQVCINNDEDNLVAADCNPFTVTGLTEDVIYAFKVRAVNGDLTSHWTDAVSVQLTDKLCLGLDGTTSNSNLPIQLNWQYTLSQQIYTTAELGTTPCSFTKVDFFLKDNIALTRNIDIYMVQTDKSTFSSNNDWVAFTVDDRVFSGEITTAKNAWTSITLTTPFMYDGQHNVVLIVHDKTGDSHSAISWATYSTNDDYQALYKYDGYEIDLTALSDLYGNWVKQKNQIRLMPGTYNTCQKPTNLTISNLTTTSATISWASEAESFDLLVDGQLVEGITTTSYEMTNLAMASVHEVQVRTDCGGGNVSPWSNAVSFTTILCNDEDKCTISYELSNNYVYGSTWYGNAIQVYDVLTDELLDSWTLLEGSTFSGTLAVCNGRQIRFAWKSASGSERCDYSVYDNNGDLIFSGTGALTTPVTHIVDGTPYLTKPTELACSATTATTATLGWTENGTATAWQICLDDDEVNLITADSTPFTVDGFTNNTFHTAKVRAVGDNINSKWSDAITFEVTSKVRIGTGTTTSNLWPTNIYYKYGLSEQIYTAAELGSETRTIESIDFYKTTNGTPTCNLDIYMVLTTKDRFSGYQDWVSVTAGDLVFSGNVTFAADAWTTITFDTPFEYDGESNLLLVVDNNTGSYGSTSSFYTFYEDYYDRSLCYSSSNYDIDPMGDLSGYTGNKQYVRNQIRIEFGDAPAVPKPAGFKTTTVYNHSAWLRWMEKGTATQWQLCVNGDEDNLINVTKQPFLLTDLSAETDYTVKVRSVNGEQTSRWTGPISFTTDSNEAPDYFEADDIGPNSAVLTWYDASDINAWQICVNDNEEQLIEVANIEGDPTYTLTGLTPQTQYSVKVRSVFPGETCPWSDELMFTTTEINPVPRKIDITTAHTTATATWLGFSDSYNVRYRTAAAIDPVYTEGFEDGLNGWTLSNCDEKTGSHGDASAVAHSGSGLFVFSYTENPPQYLISPDLTDITDGMVLQFYYRNYDSDYPETFQIGFSSTTADTDAFTFGDEITAEDEAWHRYRVAIPDGTKYICGKCTSDDQWMLCIDDITIGMPTEVDQWQPSELGVSIVETTTTLTGLTAGTDYELQVQGVVDETPSEWSATETFTTLPATTKIFFADGNWNDADKWEPAGAPTSTDDVVIQAAAVIPNGVVAWARNITIEGVENGGGGEYMSRSMTSRRASQTTKRQISPMTSTSSITIKNGGQLRHATEDLLVTVEKNIAGYDDSPTGGYHLITTPLNESWFPTEYDGSMAQDSYDLYSFTTEPADGLEWRNFKVEAFWLYPNNSNGYLCANSSDQMLTFTGTVDETATGIDYYSIVPVDGDVIPFTNGWRVFGNNAVANAYVEFGDIYNDDDDNFIPATCNFYKMNDAGDGFTLFKNYVEVAPGDAVFVETAASGRIHWSYDPLYENAPVAEEGTYNMAWLPQHGQTTHQDAHVVLANTGNNSDMITAANSRTVSIVLDDRTLYRDGYWNTLCLPFSVDLTAEGCPLAGAEARTLTSASITQETEGTTLNLTFGDAVTTLVAGTPYIIKWDEAETDIENPVFTNVTIDPTDRSYDNNASGDLRVRFLGTYESTTFTSADPSILFLGAGNSLYYPESDAFIGAFRAYFKIGGDDALSRRITDFNIDFGEGNATGIEELKDGKIEELKSESWYTLTGVKLEGKPTEKGVYIYKGKKIAIK